MVHTSRTPTSLSAMNEAGVSRGQELELERRLALFWEIAIAQEPGKNRLKDEYCRTEKTEKTKLAEDDSGWR